MSCPTCAFYVEVLPRIEAVNVTLTGSSSTNFTFTKNNISSHSCADCQPEDTTRRNVEAGVQLCSWYTPKLSIRSCREMKLIPREGLSMRFKVTSSSDNRERTRQYPTCPDFVVPKDELTEYGAEQVRLSVRCGFCHSELSLKE